MKTKLGQNFLIDKSVAEREVDYANVTKNDIVLEIGPGKGVLTNILADKAKEVIAIEIDKKLFDYLWDHNKSLRLFGRAFQKFIRVHAGFDFVLAPCGG